MRCCRTGPVLGPGGPALRTGLPSEFSWFRLSRAEGCRAGVVSALSGRRGLPFVTAREHWFVPDYLDFARLFRQRGHSRQFRVQPEPPDFLWPLSGGPGRPATAVIRATPQKPNDSKTLVPAVATAATRYLLRSDPQRQQQQVGTCCSRQGWARRPAPARPDLRPASSASPPREGSAKRCLG